MSFKDHRYGNGVFASSNEIHGGDIEYVDNFGGIAEDSLISAPCSGNEFTKSNGLDNAPTRLLFNTANMILNENIERKNGDVSHGTSFLLKKVLQLIERRMSTQAEKCRNQDSIYKAKEEKFVSKIKVLETLVKGISEENEVVKKNLDQIKVEKAKVEDKIKREESELHIMEKEKHNADVQVLNLKRELELIKSKHEKYCLQLEAGARETQLELEKKLKELELQLEDSRKRVLELEDFSQSKHRRWKKKEHKYQRFIDFHSGVLQELRVSAEFMKTEVLKTRTRYLEELNYLGSKMKGLVDAAQNYHIVLAENRRLYNEVQDLKGNIRVYCRIRPFLPGQSAKQTTIDYMGENGDLVVANPLKQGKDSHRLFKFNKVYGPDTTQEDVFGDTRPLIRSVLDGYNVCIFAYGQTGSGKTYTMSGPSVTSKEKWGVNYRALNDLFQIAQSRRASTTYEIAVQMVEIYNEQVRDLLAASGSQKRLGIWSASQPNGLAVPDASMHIVKSTKDVLELMSVGMTNRAVGATALNERSSRSHSILTVHVRGTDAETNSILRGNLHLVDLAGSERVERSEAIGERLKEAQYINKSLSALGDVIFALAQKNAHVPYRNSKLTQVLQSSLGGQAKTLMFVQLNPDIHSYSETISTLKFAERVSGVELGAARSNKEGREVRELMEQIGSLKHTISKKDEEIVHLLSSVGPNLTKERRAVSFPTLGSTSPQRLLLGTPQPGIKVLEANDGAAASNGEDNCLDYGDNSDNSDERLSDISNGGLSVGGTETDSSLSNAVEYTLFPGARNPQDSEKETETPKLPKIQQKPVEKISSRLTRSTTKVSTSSIKAKTTAGSSSSSRLVKRW